jgi:two-component system cell cycle sensor histidine kinase/response regulator CckA
MDGDFFGAVVASLGDGVLVVNSDGTIVHANPAALAVLGLPVVGSSLRGLVGELLHADGTTPYVYDELPPVRAARGEENVLADVVTRESRARLSITSRPLRQAGEPESGSVSVIRDVTAQRNAEEELSRTRMFIDSIVENIPDMIFVKDANELRFERFNRAGEELLGIPREHLLGKTDFDFFPPDQAKFFQNRDRETLRAGRLVDIPEEPINTARGLRWLHTKKIPILDERGVPLHLLGISSDITEKRTAEEALKQAHEELERRVVERTEALQRTEEQLRHAQKLEAVGRLAGGVAHDFNNVLAVILGHVGLLSREIRSDEAVREGLDSIRVAAEHAAALTRQLLAFSRKQDMQPRVLNLNRVVEHARAMLARLLGEDVRLLTELAPDLGNVHADPALIEQVIVNLAVNARDAMPEGGTLTIETRSVRVAQGASDGPAGLLPGTYSRLRVTDTGVGMDGETTARIFEPFFTTKAPGKGTGLGLSMAYGVITQSGGTIGVHSRPGEGTSFSVYLPVAMGRRSETPSPSARLVIRGGGETILLAEDEAPLRSVLRSVLKEAGYFVLDAGSGEDALVIAARYDGPIHLLLSDVVMPAMTGPELARRLLEVRPALRVLFMSGYTDDRVSGRTQDVATTEPLSKPFSAEVLTERVRAALAV